MVVFWLLIIASIIFTLYTLKYVWSWVFITQHKSSAKERTVKRLKDSTDKFMYDTAPKDTLLEQLKKYTNKIPFLALTKEKQTYIESLLETTDIRKNGYTATVTDIYLSQLNIAFVIIVISVIASIFFFPSIFALFAIPLVMKFPLMKYELEFSNNLNNFMYQFPSFYDSILCQYQEKEANVLLGDIVQNYMAVASKQAKRILKRFLIDLESGQEYALDKLQIRFTEQPIICKFCSVMKNRIQNADDTAIASMVSLSEELESMVADYLERDLESRETKANRCTLIILMSVFIMSILVFFYNLAFMSAGF